MGILIKLGERTLIRKLERRDIDKMINWGKHKDPKFLHYNFPYLTEEERDIWYKFKTKKINKKCFAVDDMNGDLIGYISLRDIKFFKRESELGIVFDPNILGKGYGTDALTAFLDLYFNQLKMKTMILRVAKFNERAIRCYEKCGFKITDEYISEFEEQCMNTKTKNNIVEKSRHFTIESGILKTVYLAMKITKEEYDIHIQRDKLLINL